MKQHRKYNHAIYLEYVQQGERCFYCKEPVQYEYIVEEHLLPRSRGFAFPNNKVYSCRWCDGKKGRLTIYLFREYLSHAFAFYAKANQQKICDKIANAIRTCTELIKDKNSILWKPKLKNNHNRRRKRDNPYHPKYQDVFLPPKTHYNTNLTSNLIRANYT